MIPTFHFVEIATSNDEAAKAADAENASRAAIVEVQQESKGIGQHRLPKPITFPVIFRDEPHFTFGSATVSRVHDGLYHDPRGCSGVYAWIRDGNGNYIGAKCWLRVDIEAIASTIDYSKLTAAAAAAQLRLAGTAGYRRQQAALEKARFDVLSAKAKSAQGAANLSKIVVEHYLTFSGVAIKQLPTKTLSAALNPRTVGL